MLQFDVQLLDARVITKYFFVKFFNAENQRQGILGCE